MNKLLHISMVLITANALAQPVISNSSNLAPVGLTVPLKVTTITNPGAGGMNQTWDFSSQVYNSAGMVEVITPSSSSIGSSFVDADYALSLIGPNTFSFFNVTTSKMEVLAWNISAPGSNNDYSPNPRTVLKFPFNYLDTINDVWQEAGASPSNVTLTYDGYGTFISSTNTYNNVVRVQEDYGSGGIDYQWYILNPLMTIAIFDHNTNTLYHFGASQISGLPTEGEVDENLVLYPDASGSSFFIKDISGRVDVEISDLAGKLILSETINGPLPQINTASFANGIYIIKVKEDSKERHQKILLNK